MLKLVSVGILGAAMLPAQYVVPQRPASNGLTKTAIWAEMITRSRANQAAADSMRRQESIDVQAAENIRLQNEILKLDLEARKKAQQSGIGQEEYNRNVVEAKAAVERLQKRYPDFADAGDEMIELERRIQGGELTMEQYLESLYLVAKLSSFSRYRERSVNEKVLVYREQFPELKDSSSQLFKAVATELNTIIKEDYSVSNSPAVLKAAIEAVKSRIQAANMTKEEH